MTKGLPRGVVEKRGNYYLRTRKHRLETYIALPKPDDPSFETALCLAREGGEPCSRKKKRWPARHELSLRVVRADAGRTRGYGAGEQAPRWLIILAREARKRAIRKKLEFSLTLPQLLTLARRADNHCEVTGLPFVHDPEGYRRRPFAPSIDRIDSSIGYTFSNVRIVCCCVNAALNEWGDDVFWKMVFAAANGRWGNQFPQGVGEPNKTGSER